MICQPCRDGVHAGGEGYPLPVCPGKGQCDCQHRTRVCGAVDAEHGDGLCGLPARLYACGWRCEGHKP